MAPDLTFLIRLWRQRAAEQHHQARQLGPTFDGTAALSAARATGQCADELALALGQGPGAVRESGGNLKLPPG